MFGDVAGWGFFDAVSAGLTVGAGGADFTIRTTGGGVAARRFCSTLASSGFPGFACSACCFCANATGAGGGVTLATTGRLATAAGGFGGALKPVAFAILAPLVPITLAFTGTTGAV